MLGYLVLLNLIIFISAINDNPEFTFVTQAGIGSAVKISPYQNKIAVGHANGVVRIYDFQGILQTSFLGHKSRIIDIEWIPSYGPVTLDAQAKAIRWTQYGTTQFVWKFQTYVSQMTITYGAYNRNTSLLQQTQQYFIAFNLKNQIRQYLAINGNYIKSYYPENNQTLFDTIQYTYSYNFLSVSSTLNTRKQIQIYNCSTGILQENSTQINSSVVSFGLKNNEQIYALTKNGLIYKCNYQEGVCIDLTYKPINIASSMIYCRTVNNIITAQYLYDDLDIFDQNAFFQKYLTYMESTIAGIDCSSNFLVSLDQSGFVAINRFPVGSGILGLIIFCCIVLGVIIFLIVKKVRQCCQRRGNKGGLLEQDPYSSSPIVQPDAQIIHYQNSSHQIHPHNINKSSFQDNQYPKLNPYITQNQQYSKAKQTPFFE